MFPIVQRELMVAAKNSSTSWFRVAPAAFGALCVIGAMLLSFTTVLASQGRIVFNLLGGLLFLFCLLAGMRFTVDSITAERRNGTLELLRLSGMSGLEIVIGKMAAQALPAVLALSAVLPMLAFPVLLGGVSGAEVARAIAVLLGTLLLSLSIAIFVSSDSATLDESMKKALLFLDATFLFGSATLLYFLNGPFLKSRQATPSVIRSRNSALRLFAGSVVAILPFEFSIGSPALLMYMVFTKTPIGGRGGYYVGLGFLFAMSWVFIRLAGTFEAILPGSEPHSPVQTQPGYKHATRRFRPKDGPLSWLFKHRRRGLNTMLICAGASLLWVVAAPLIMAMGGTRLYYVFSYAGFLPPALLAFFMAQEAGHPLQRLRETGMLELLWVSPFSWKDIVRAQTNQFLKSVKVPIALIFIAYLPPLLWYTPITRTNYGLFYLCSVPFALATILAEAFAIFWVAFHFVLHGKNALSAGAMVVGWIFIAPLLILSPLIGMIVAMSGAVGSLPYGPFFAYQILHVIVYLAFIAWAKPKVECWSPSTFDEDHTRLEM